ncbi:MAG: hypothetical protein JWN17_3045 [Frankiales bacterium]|nr:hypothetical protein [Frankiales bacterium]
MSLRRVRLWTDLSLVRATTTVHLLEPLSPAVLAHHDREPRRAALGAGWQRAAPERFVLAPLEDSDLAVLPFAWEDTLTSPDLLQAARAFAARAAAAGRSTLVFCHDDRVLPVDLPRAVVFRPSLWGARRAAADVALPGWVLEPAEGPVSPRPWEPVPSVGFCGFSPPLGVPRPPGLPGVLHAGKDHVRTAATRLGLSDRLGLAPQLVHRSAALRVLLRDPRVRAEVVLRSDRFRLTRTGFAPVQDLDPTVYRREYVENLLGTDYALSVRGYGNFSFRFYEALAAGRVPLLVDTDCVLPLAREVDWPALVVRVPARRTRSLVELLLAEHAALDPDAWRERQLRARSTWTERLTVHGFFSTVHARLVRAAQDRPLHGPEGHAALLACLSDPAPAWPGEGSGRK